MRLFKLFIHVCFLSLYSSDNFTPRIIPIYEYRNYSSDYEVTVVGAGPAGITVIGILMDLGVPAESIMWIDPLFNVGRIGEYYQNVPGNAKNKKYIEFLQSCKTFQNVKSESIDYLYSLDMETCDVLKVIADPLQDITNYLRNYVHSTEGLLEELFFHNGLWNIKAKNKYFSSKHVILATGSKPKVLDYEVQDIIPLDYAIDKITLSHMVKPHDTIAVVGSSHSAALILKFLTELQVKQIISLYKHPFVFAIDMGSWTLNNTNGLKGVAAQWVQEVLLNNPPHNLLRILNTEENRKKYLKECNKIVYAVGFEKSPYPEISGDIQENELEFNPQTGVIGPRLFGIGIAFAATYVDPQGNKEQYIGLNGFMKFALQMVPLWIETKDIAKIRAIEEQRRVLEKYDSLFDIWMY